jgi:hypothetical protein
VAQFTPLPSNGDVALDLVSAGTFSIYYNVTPNGDWSDPASFSSGKLFATFHRQESLFSQIGPISFHSLSENLVSSSSFNFDDRSYDFKCIALICPLLSTSTSLPRALWCKGRAPVRAKARTIPNWIWASRSARLCTTLRSRGFGSNSIL